MPGLDGSLPLQPVASSVAANPSHREAEPLHWELYVPQKPFKEVLDPNDCRLKVVRVLEGGPLSSSQEEGSMSEGRPVFPPQLCKTEPTFTKRPS